MPRAKRPESQFEGQCVKDLRALGYLVYTHADSPRNRKNSRSDSGFPDIVAAGRGRVVFLECKEDGKNLTPKQTDWAQAIESALMTSNFVGHGLTVITHMANLYYGVAMPSTWEGILEELA